jgi:NAD(P)-dependent dehydrogenase (short-subunit alcohol dehydrogenase family)
MNVSGKVIVVTGAGSGIGRAVVLEAVRRGGGARVAACDINEATVAETAALAGGSRPGGRAREK